MKTWMNARLLSRRVAMEELVGISTASTNVSVLEDMPARTARTTRTIVLQVDIFCFSVYRPFGASHAHCERVTSRGEAMHHRGAGMSLIILIPTQFP